MRAPAAGGDDVRGGSVDAAMPSAGEEDGGEGRRMRLPLTRANGYPKTVRAVESGSKERSDRTRDAFQLLQYSAVSLARL